jgi:formylglycine-generating enzyme required for sulfatase activity
MRIWFAIIGFIWFVIQSDGRQRLPCPSAPAAGTRCTVGGAEFVAIPGGQFAMGDSSNLAQPIERPVHDVMLDPFWIANTELTFRQWKAFLTATDHPRGRASAQSEDHPVVSITWDDAKAYCDWFSKAHGVIVRLPSEAEWEYAARGGLGRRQYPNGDSITPADANYASQSPLKVASFRPNGYGLYDMAGNVFEWTGDWYAPDYYQRSPRENPRGPATDENRPQRRADRGGGWCMGVDKVRVSARHAGPGSWDKGGTADCLGFRPVMERSPAR